MEDVIPLEEMTKREMKEAGYYNVQAVLEKKYCRVWYFLTALEKYGLEETNWEPICAFMQRDRTVNEALKKYLT